MVETATQVSVNFETISEFASENGYLLALYRKDENGNWELRDECFLNDDDVIFDASETFIARQHGGIDFTETVTPDKKWLFVLHNNYNIPKVIPCN
jgi:hypothetical protein